MLHSEEPRALIQTRCTQYTSRLRVSFVNANGWVEVGTINHCEARDRQ